MSNCDYQTLGVILHQKDKVLHVLVDYYSYFVLIFERCYSQICIYAYWAFKVPIKEERTESCLLQTHFDKSALLFTAGPCGERLKRNSGHTSKSKTGKWKLLD